MDLVFIVGELDGGLFFDGVDYFFNIGKFLMLKIGLPASLNLFALKLI